MIPLGPVRWSDVVGRPLWRWATVTATSPELRITVDGELDPIGVEPTVLGHVGPLTMGARVRIRITPGGAVDVVGRAGMPQLRPLLLTDGWTPYGAPWAQPTFMVDGAGFVRLDGMVSGGTSATIATLPVGARPLGQTVLSTAGSGASPHRRVDVHPSGVIELVTLPEPTWLSLSGLSFPAAR